MIIYVEITRAVKSQNYVILFVNKNAQYVDKITKINIAKNQ